MQTHFQLEKYGATVSSECMAGLTSFLVVSYILVINPLILLESGMPFSAIFTATALTAGVCTLIVSLYANVPFAMAPGMSLNAFIAQSVCVRLGFVWQEALCIAFTAGLIHCALMISPARRAIVTHCLPKCLKFASAIGIGAFVTVGGINYAGLVNHATSTTKNVAFDISAGTGALPHLLGRFSHSNLVAILGLLFIICLLALERKNGVSYAAFPLGIIAATFVGIPLGVTSLPSLHNFSTELAGQFRTLFLAFYGDPGLMSLLGDPSKSLLAIALSLVIFLSSALDSVITVMGLGSMDTNRIFSDAEWNEFTVKRGGRSNRIDRAITANSLGGSIAAALGTTPAIIYIESSLGIAAKGRTGLASLVTGMLFLLSIPLAGFLHMLPAEAVGAALILSGVYPLQLIRRIDWTDMEQALPCGLTILFMMATNNFLGGLALGAVMYLVIQVVLGKVRALRPAFLASTFLLAAATIMLHLFLF